jgi:hypothetical protein
MCNHDRHVRHYHAALDLLAWIEVEGLTFDCWTYRKQADHEFVDGIGVIAHDSSGKVYRNAAILR